MVPRHGGARPNSGPKPRDSERSVTSVEFETQRARHEKIKADQRELKLAIERGEYLPRAAQQQASAAFLAIFTQSMRSIPDNLERTLALEPRVVEAIAVGIDAALAELAGALKAMAGDD